MTLRPQSDDFMVHPHTERILTELAQMYPDARCALVHRNAFELLVATVLSAQCTDQRVNMVTASLFQKYATPEAFAGLTPQELEPEIKELGLFRSKAKNLVKLGQQLIERHSGEVPRTREELEALAGVGRKTANVVLSNAFDVPAIAVDTHVFRVARRIGLASGTTVLAVERELMAAIPRDTWTQAHHWLIHHGRELCDARRPRCEECPLQVYCDYGNEQTSQAAKRPQAK